MNEDYLWDRTGEPDPEIQQLEQILGTLRYHPRELEIPDKFEIKRNGNFFRAFGPRLAIAATIALVLFGLGLWLGLRRLQDRQPATAQKVQPARVPSSIPSPAPTVDQNQKVATTANDSSRGSDAATHRPRLKPNFLANASYRASARNRSQALRELQEAKAAKDQLMLALRMTSAKLSYAQKKTQNSNPRDLIHNQHKIG